MDDVISGNLTSLMDLYVNKGYVEKAVANELIALFNDEIFSFGADYSFLYDIIFETLLPM